MSMNNGSRRIWKVLATSVWLDENCLGSSIEIIQGSAAYSLKFIAPLFGRECLSQGSYYCDEPRRLKQLEKERLYLASTSISLFIIEGIRKGTQPGQDHRGVRLTDLLSLAYVAFFLIEPRTTSQGMTPLTTGCALPTSIIT